MAIEIDHNVPKAVRQLLGAPSDLREILPEQGESRSLAAATKDHQAQFARYCADFATVYPLAEEWWEGLVGAFLDEGLDRPGAVDEAYDKRPAGPASAPEFVWLVRHHWLEFDAINRRLEPQDRVPPETCLLGWLVEEKREDYVRLLTCMPYWPIGLDAQGNWC